MFMTACRSQNAYNIVATMQIFRPKWKEQESLGEFVERVFPLCDVPDQGSRNVTIRAHKLTAHYLKQYLNIQYNGPITYPTISCSRKETRGSLCTSSAIPAFLKLLQKPWLSTMWIHQQIRPCRCKQYITCSHAYFVTANTLTEAACDPIF
jgi:hypothetical protein